MRVAPAISISDRNALAIVKGRKPLENRAFALQGWRWIHSGKKPTAAKHAAVIDAMTDTAPDSPHLRGCVIGAAHFATCITYADAVQDPTLKPWAFGPKCSLIDDVFMLPTPVPARGALSNWAPSANTVAKLKKSFELMLSSSTRATIVHDDDKSDYNDAVAIRAALRALNSLRCTFAVPLGDCGKHVVHGLTIDAASMKQRA